MSNFKIVGNANPTVGQKEMYSVADTFSVNMPTANTVTNNPLFPEAKVNWSMQQLVGGNWIVKENTKKTGNEVPYTFTEATLEYDDLKIVAEKNGQEVSIKIKPKKSLERKIVTVTFLDENWNPPTRRFAYGDKIIARIHCVNLDGCHGKIVLYEDDEPYNVNTDYNRNNKFTTVPIFIEDGKAEAHFILNPNFAKLANSSGDKDHGNQEGEFHEYYITVEIFNQKPFESQNIEVQNPDYNDPQILRKNFHNNSPVNYYETKVEVLAQIREIGDSIREITNKALMVDSNHENWWTKKEDTCVCKGYDLSWGNKFTCEERKKVVQLCSNLWGESSEQEMANHLINCMALETGESFKPSIGFPNATGLVQFTDSAIEGMNINDKYNKGVKLTKERLSKMTILEQLDYVELYFKMWIDSGSQINNSLDMYMCIWCPAAVGKEDSFVCYSEEKDKKRRELNINAIQPYHRNKSIDGEYYSEKGNTILKGEKNKEITKGELYPRLKVKEVSGKMHKAIIRTCQNISTLDNPEIDIPKGIAWLESLEYLTMQEVLDGKEYPVPYKNDYGEKGRTEDSEFGLKNFDCSELVCRYLQKIEWSSKVKLLATKDLYNYAQKYPHRLEEHEKEYKPKKGDIFLWKNNTGGMGHTGIVMHYDETLDIVTTMEAVSSNEKSGAINKKVNLKGLTKCTWKREDYHLIGHEKKECTPCRFYTPKIHYTKL